MISAGATGSGSIGANAGGAATGPPGGGITITRGAAGAGGAAIMLGTALWEISLGFSGRGSVYGLSCEKASRGYTSFWAGGGVSFFRGIAFSRTKARLS